MSEKSPLRTAVLIVCAVALVVLGIGVKMHLVAAADRLAAMWFTRHITPARTTVALTVTQLGSAVFTLGTTAIISALFLAQQSRYWLERLLLTVAGGMASNEALKFVFYRARPHFERPLVQLYTNSFPSGHALDATVLFGTLIILIGSLARSLLMQITVATLGVCLIFMVAISRLYLGVHYLSDVTGGVLEGMLWIALVGLVLQKFTGNRGLTG